MAFGAVAGLAVLCLVGSRYPIRSVARAAGLMAVSMTFGAGLSMKGSLDLIHGSGAGGSGDALVWGMAGLFLKAGLWMAMAGAFLGAGLGRRRCGPWDVLLPYLAVLPLWHLGIAWLNRPFDPAAREFPAIYFSARTVPEGEILPESWGGMLLALAGAILCCAFRRNALPAILALYGFLAGGFGAVLGQAVPALLARNPGLFRTGPMEGQPLGVLLDSQDWGPVGKPGHRGGDRPDPGGRDLVQPGQALPQAGPGAQGAPGPGGSSCCGSPWRHGWPCPWCRMRPPGWRTCSNSPS